MLAHQRQNEILELINARKFVEVKELSEICKVSSETIRQDLKKLEEEKKLLRVHGGAQIRTRPQEEIPYYIREVANIDLKREIANEAVKIIHPYEQIIMDCSSTCLFLAQALPNIPLTVLTNSIRITEALVDKDNVQVVLVGGILQRSSLSFVGQLAERTFSNYKVHKLFLCGKVQYDFGISEPNEYAVSAKKRMIDIADEVIVLADHHKFGEKDFMQIIPLERVNKIITDSKIGPRHISDLKEYANRITIAQPLNPLIP